MTTIQRPEGPGWVVRWFHPSWLWWYPKVVLLAALGMGAALATRYALVVADAPALLVPVVMFLVIPALALAYNAIQDLANRTTIVAAPETIEVRWGPRGTGTRSVDVGPLHRIGVQVHRGRASLWALAADRGGQVVAHSISPEAAFAVADHLRDHYDVPRDDPPEAVSRPLWRPLLVVLASVAVIGYAGWALAQPPIRDLVASGDVIEGPAPLKADLGEPTPVEVWMRMAVGIEDVVNSDTFHVAELSPAYRLRIALDGPTGPLTLDCDPFDIAFFVNQSTTSGIRASTVSWYGQVSNCGTELPAGVTQGTAELIRGDGAGALRLEQAEVLLRS